MAWTKRNYIIIAKPTPLSLRSFGKVPSTSILHLFNLKSPHKHTWDVTLRHVRITKRDNANTLKKYDIGFYYCTCCDTSQRRHLPAPDELKHAVDADVHCFVHPTIGRHEQLQAAPAQER